MLNVLSKCLQIHCVDSMLALFFERRSIVYTLRDHAAMNKGPSLYREADFETHFSGTSPDRLLS